MCHEIDKKNSSCPPPGITCKKRPSHAGRENPWTHEPLPPPLHKPLVVALVRIGRPSGHCLHVLWCEGRRGDFLTSSLNSLPLRVEPRTECYWDHIINTSRHPFACHEINWIHFQSNFLMNVILIVVICYRNSWPRKVLDSAELKFIQK